MPPGDDNYPNSGCKFTPSGTLESKKLVIGITIDESGSVGSANFETAKNSVAAFIKEATDACAPPPQPAVLYQALTCITRCISFWLPTFFAWEFEVAVSMSAWTSVSSMLRSLFQHRW